MADSVGLFAAFLGGAVSFLAPCVLPLIPGYISFIAGMSAGGSGDEARSSREVVVPSALFVLGFSAVFVLMGAAAGFASGTLGPALASFKQPLTIASGLAVAVFGVLLLDVVKVPWLYREVRADLTRSRRFGRFGALVMGAAFGFGWTPCVGPVLAVILGMAAQTGDSARAAVLLLAYSAGLGLPFLLTAATLERIGPLLRVLQRHSAAVSRFSGAVLVVMGALIASGQMGRLSAALVRLLPFLGSIG